MEKEGCEERGKETLVLESVEARMKKKMMQRKRIKTKTVKRV